MISLLIAAALASPAAGAARPEKAMEWNGQYGGPAEPGAEIAADEAAWKRLWLKVGRPAPALDFKRHFAAAVFAGERPTGGYAIEILDPAVEGKDWVVRYRVKQPGGFAIQAITQPWRMRAFPKGKAKARLAPVEGETR